MAGLSLAHWLIVLAVVMVLFGAGHAGPVNSTILVMQPPLPG